MDEDDFDPNDCSACGWPLASCRCDSEDLASPNDVTDFHDEEEDR